jgi:hypothetical protein
MKTNKIRFENLWTSIQSVFTVEIGQSERPGFVNNDHYIYLRNTQL